MKGWVGSKPRVECPEMDGKKTSECWLAAKDAGPGELAPTDPRVSVTYTYGEFYLSQ